ncbi:MAG TPA: hypothetical protein VGB54_03805 [Allosphingosinicella sp.]|jgi:predicted secreted protein
MVSMLALVLMSNAYQQPTTAQPAPARPAAERRVCRVQERLGTILPRRVCRSASDWAAIDGVQERITDRDSAHMRNNGRTSMHDPSQPIPR